SSLVETFFGNFKPGSLSRVGGWKMTAGATGLALGALAAGIAGSIYAATQDDGANTVQQVLNGVILAVSIAGAVGMLAKASQAIEDGAQGIAKIVAAATAPASRAGQIAGVVGLIIGELVNYGLLIAQIAISSLTVGGLIANQLAAQSIASSVMAGMMFALASTGIGAIVVAIIGLIDGLVFLICGFLDKDQTDSTAGQIFCKGISGWLTQLVSFFIYAQNEITRVGDPYRLNYLAFNPGLRNPAAGFTPGAAVSLTLAVRNTLALAHLPVNIGIFYWHQFNADVLQSARFAYDIVPASLNEDAVELDDSLTRGAGANPWAVLERDADGDIVTVYDDADVVNRTPMTLTSEAGLNRKIPAFLAEGYAVPVQECVSNATFLFPLPPVVVCWVRSRGETNYNDLNLVFDVLPATLDEFYRLEPAGAQPGRVRLDWANNPSLPFPALMDADGDGLRYDADRDDTRWDTDGDGLSDAVEQARSTNPANRDSDEDGLTDVQEQMWRTDPLSADSDGDGLSDGDEVRGWAIGYGVAANGSVLPGWTYSDPLKRDSDKDAILDAQERVYGFNPNVANDPTVLIYEAQVTEPESPLLLTRFEERTGAKTFSDSATAAAGGNIAACIGSCPTAGHRGRFGNALHFNGTDQHLAIPPNKAIGDLRTNISLSAWVKPSKLTGQQAVIHIGPGGANGAGGLTFGLSGDDLYVQFEGLGAAGLRVQLLAAGVIALDQWSHIAVEIYGNTGQLYFYANDVTSGNQPGLVKVISHNPEIIIGAAQQPASNVAPGKDGTIPNVQVNHFAGLLDEALIQGWVPQDKRSIEALFAGRYNPNDTILRPGQAVAYGSYLENALLARAISGRRQINYAPDLTDKAAEVKPFALEPARAASFSEAFTVRAALASGPYTLTQSVDATVSIPARDMWKDPAGAKIYDWPGPQTYAGT
ncbi:MAG: LamGL protein, partial [Chloroflexota bacterium]|nr:LamGL protein [Chloroflexota bacterium]